MTRGEATLSTPISSYAPIWTPRHQAVGLKENGLAIPPMTMSRVKRLEQYTLQNPQEVLIVTVKSGDVLNEVMIFRGFSSSLTQPTAFDPDVPIFTDDDEIVSVDRVRSPYDAANPDYLDRQLSESALQVLLEGVGLSWII